MTKPMSKDKPDTLSLWSEAQSFERALREHELRKRQQRSLALVDTEAGRLRLCLLELYEDLIVVEPTFAAAKNIDDKLWNVVFYVRLEELRSLIRKTEQNPPLLAASEELQNHLNMAISFYQTLLLTMKSTFEEDLIAFGIEQYVCKRDAHGEPLSDVQMKMSLFHLIHKCTVYLGDLSRYREIHSLNNGKNWQSPRYHYLKAIRINPDIGKPYSQLAIVASYTRSDLEVIYWYCLSLANLNPHSVTKENITAFYNSQETKAMLQSSEPQSPRSPLQQATTDFLTFHRQIFDPESVVMGDLLSSYMKTIELVRAIPTTSSQAVPLPDWLRMVMPILAATYYDMDQRFGKTDQTAVRHRVRIIQVFLAAMVFDFLAIMLDVLLNNMTETEVAMEALAESPDASPLFGYLSPIALMCAWLEMNLNVFVMFLNYAKTIKEAEVVLPTVTKFLRSLGKFANIISSFADMDGSIDCLPEDADLLGFLPLRNYYQQLDMESIEDVLKDRQSAVSDQMAIRMARVARFAMKLSEDERIDFFRFNETDGTFNMLDEDAKKKEMHKLMKALATERLKDQVSTLEQNINKLKELSCPMILIDTNGYVNHLGFVKKWLASRKSIVIVPMDVIDNLDRLKKGTEKINAKAREAIRYLEQRFRYRSEYLRGQQDEERIALWDREGTLPNSAGFVPKHMRSILACALYYQTRVAPQPLDETDVPFALVTDDTALTEVACGVGVVVRGVQEWKSFIEEKIRKR
ncbi:hypothetical protein SpCBS45565_g06822 [Spizellomyces sp. 'palustris']|nr:hypothetical protein SpCBS45565_g06822 [Spizellomyces sp. 'palustris']